MTLVKFNKPAGRSFNNLMDDLFPVMPSLFRDSLSTPAVPVNVKENEKEYVLEIIAPGMEKENFKIDLDNNVLTVSAAKKTEEEAKDSRQIRREYRYESFSRSFTIEDTIDAENIAAKYLNGVLTLNLPKKAAVKEPGKQISIQ